MQVRVGQRWITRDGSTAIIDRVDAPSTNTFYLFFGKVNDMSESWTADGLARFGAEGPHDLDTLLSDSPGSSSNSRDYFVEIMSKPVRAMW
jgi:hypothetical protein